MTANSTLRITELDPNTIKENLKTYLKSQSEFQDYNFEGSGLNILLDLLAYNTHYMAFYMNMLGSEAFIDTAQLRSSLVSHAKHIGYVPNGKTPATAFVNVKVTPGNAEDDSPGSLTLPRWTQFIGESLEGVNYPYVAINSNNAVKINGAFNFSNVVLKQGQVQTKTWSVNAANDRREYTIPSANVDINEIYVTVQESATNTYFEIYNKFEDLTELTSNSKVYFIEELPGGNGHFKLYFGDGFLGKKPSNGNIVTVTYLDTVGDIGNGANSFILYEDVGGYSQNVIITTRSPSTGGAKAETNEEIRYRAPLHYSTQNRAVTTLDYQALISKDYPNIDSIAVWGGETEEPPVYGKVYISLKPVSNYYITELEKQRILNDLIRNRSVLTVIPEIVNPDYTYLKLDTKVFYDKNKTNLDEGQLKALVRDAILEYRDDKLKKFDAKFRISNLQKYIQDADPAFNSCTAVVTMQKRILPTLNDTKNYTINFKQKLKKGVINSEKLSSFPAIQVYDNTGVLRNCFVEEIPNSASGISKYRVITEGSGYEDAKVTISGDGTGAKANAKIINKSVREIVVTAKGSLYQQASVAITSNTGTGATATADLQFDEGTLRLYYYRTNGQKVILNSNLGTINYKTGILQINNLNVFGIIENDNYNFDVLTLNVLPYENDILSVRNAIIDIDENDASSINIQMIPE